MALLSGGKKMNFNKEYFDRLAIALHLNDKQSRTVYTRLGKWLPDATQLIEMSFLTEDYESVYKDLITQRAMQFAVSH